MGIKKLLVFFASLSLVIITIFGVLSIYMGNSPLNKKRFIYIDYISVFPQGWGFFTKDPREPLVFIYKHDNNDYKSIIERNFSTKNLLGLSRKNRILIIESSHVLKEIIKNCQYKNFKATNINRLKTQFKNIDFDYEKVYVDSSLSPDIVGDFIFVIQEQLPWSLIYKDPKYKSNFKVYSVKIIHK
ncbi:SdpA family antimicrobial peptide system protein [Ornithobacterium rhinotracheale]